jgi:hypothetical protein
MKLLKEYIENIVKSYLAEYKSGFNINYFKSIKDAKEMLKYAGDMLQTLGVGSGRAAFLLPNTNKVLKIALRPAGIAQNEQEASVFTNPQTQEVVTKIYDFDPEYKWLISETAREFVTKEEFDNKVGIDFDAFVGAIQLGINWQEDISDFVEEMYDDKTPGERQKKINDLLNNKDFVNKAIAMKSATKTSIGDMSRVEHWGYTSDGRIVLLDYGASLEIVNKFYPKNKDFNLKSFDDPTVDTQMQTVKQGKK